METFGNLLETILNMRRESAKKKLIGKIVSLINVKVMHYMV